GDRSTSTRLGSRSAFSAKNASPFVSSSSVRRVRSRPRGARARSSSEPSRQPPTLLAWRPPARRPKENDTVRKLEGYLVTFLFAASTVLACANTLDAGVDVIDDTPADPGFVSPDASEASARDASGVPTAQLCVATSCPAPFATCPGGKLCASD